jgi:dienelactone hydrolase
VVPSVVCNTDPLQSYALYLPSRYESGRKWPILFCLDPRARGRVPVERFAEAAERRGVILAASNNSRNGPIAPVQEAIRAMVNDAHSRFSIDDSRVYVAGFSGGARIALAWAGNGQIAGAIACGAAFSAGKLPDELPFRLYMAAGLDDFNHDEMWESSLALAKRGMPHRFVEFDGGHDWLPAGLASDALDFLAGLVGPNPAVDSKEARKAAARFRDWSDRLSDSDRTARRSTLAQLHRDADKSEDTAERRVARRLLGWMLVSGVEDGRRRMEAKQYREAADDFDAAAHAKPEQADLWYAAAVAYAGAGDRKEALNALARAFAQGFNDRERAQNEPLLAPLRSDARFQTLMRK